MVEGFGRDLIVGIGFLLGVSFAVEEGYKDVV